MTTSCQLQFVCGSGNWQLVAHSDFAANNQMSIMVKTFQYLLQIHVHVLYTQKYQIFLTDNYFRYAKNDPVVMYIIFITQSNLKICAYN